MINVIFLYLESHLVLFYLSFFLPLIMKLILLCIALTLSNIALTQTYRLEIKVSGLCSNKGMLHVALYDNETNFLSTTHYFQKKVHKVKNNFETVIFENLIMGNYAVSIFHDENLDQKCNRNFFGIPTECYGFSVNYRPKLRAPIFSDCVFQLVGDKIIEIKLIK